MNGNFFKSILLHHSNFSFDFSLGYQSFMLSLKSQISMLDNFVIKEESISPINIIATLPASQGFKDMFTDSSSIENALNDVSYRNFREILWF